MTSSYKSLTENDMIRIAILVSDGFPLLSLSLVTEPLRIANRESPRPVFDWRILSADGTPCHASSGLAVDVAGGLDDDPADAVLLLTSYRPEKMQTRAIHTWLRRRARAGALMGCVDTGALIFAGAGLLDRRPAAVHHEALAAYREARGDKFLPDRLFDFGGDRCSSAGGVATFDMTLAMISHFRGRQLARRVAEVLYYRPLNSATDEMDALLKPLKRISRDLSLAVDLMSENIETPVKISDLSQRLNLPVWRLRRLFLRHLGQSPQRYYLDLRLNRARNLLRNSGESVGTIAMMCGFPAAESLSRAYKGRYGLPPSRDRRL